MLKTVFRLFGIGSDVWVDLLSLGVANVEGESVVVSKNVEQWADDGAVDIVEEKVLARMSKKEAASYDLLGAVQLRRSDGSYFVPKFGWGLKPKCMVCGENMTAGRMVVFEGREEASDDTVTDAWTMVGLHARCEGEVELDGVRVRKA